MKNTGRRKAKGKAMDTNTDEIPGHYSQSQQLGSSPKEEEMGHWTPTGAEPMDQWMDGWNTSTASYGLDKRPTLYIGQLKSVSMVSYLYSITVSL